VGHLRNDNMELRLRSQRCASCTAHALASDRAAAPGAIDRSADDARDPAQHPSRPRAPASALHGWLRGRRTRTGWISEQAQGRPIVCVCVRRALSSRRPDQHEPRHATEAIIAAQIDPRAVAAHRRCQCIFHDRVPHSPSMQVRSAVRCDRPHTPAHFQTCPFGRARACSNRKPQSRGAPTATGA